jgi:hypothetical protein
MNKFPMLDALLKLTIALTIGLLEVICVAVYCCIPIGVFMLLLSLKSKSSKATAISTFLTDRSEFQHIFPNFLLVIVEPALLKTKVQHKVRDIQAYLNKYKAILIAGAVIILLTLALLTFWHLTR